MASLEDLQAAANAVAQAVTDVIAKAQADAAAAPAPPVEPDFQATVDTLNAAAAAAEAFVNPPPAE